MKKIIKWGLIIFVGFIVLGLIFGDGDETKESFDEGKEVGQQSESQVKQHAVLSGKDPETGEVLVPDINVWEEAGSGGPKNVAIGDIPHDTKVEVIESREVEDVTFYHVRSSVGKVSVLPTDFNLRKKKMEELPQSEWTVPADESFPVEGWVHQDFITNLE